MPFPPAAFAKFGPPAAHRTSTKAVGTATVAPGPCVVVVAVVVLTVIIVIVPVLVTLQFLANLTKEW